MMISIKINILMIRMKSILKVNRNIIILGKQINQIVKKKMILKRIRKLKFNIYKNFISKRKYQSAIDFILNNEFIK